MENSIDHPLTLTVEQAAKVLGIGRSTAYELVHTGDIPSLRLGRRIVVPVGQIAEQLGVTAAELCGLGQAPSKDRRARRAQPALATDRGDNHDHDVMSLF